MSINVPTEKAKAVIDAMEREMMDKIATKTDLEHVHEMMSRDILLFKTEFDHRLAGMESRLTIKLGTVAVVVAGMLFGLLHLTL